MTTKMKKLTKKAIETQTSSILEVYKGWPVGALMVKFAEGPYDDKTVQLAVYVPFIAEGI